ncbi:hypothetical protein [Gimesia sp.]|uniref:hypothetical protein n=1 Tax=Gimesia sp. TaxID=2024833 RepID=UPI003A8E0CD4
MILAQVETWPAPLLEYLESQSEILLAHARHDCETMNAYLAPKKIHIPTAMMPRNPHKRAREDVAQTIHDLLQSTTLRGWHCTRLTKHEVEQITTQGMQLPNLQILHDRIRRVQAAHMLEDQIAQRLIDENEADDSNRKGMIWFCFFEPRLAGQSGIERFFRRWGGEVLYNSHECDPHTGKVLQLVGRPYINEADILISSFGRNTYLSDKVIFRYLLSRGFNTGQELEHEDKSYEPIPAASIVRFVIHGEPEFAALTDCDSWDPPLGEII